ncbi:DUF3857 domain-containing protein [Maribacter sp.]|uniref:DUF3857 domain-containing protein n=1 Tax=Maribacter sp. TaxID=1897614 RepID=UPI00329A598D
MRFLYFICFFIVSNTAIGQQYHISRICPDLLKNADAVVRLDRMNILVKTSDYMEVTSTRVVTVFNKKGAKHVNAVTYYDNETSLKYLTAKVYNAEGVELKEFKEEDFLDQRASGAGMLYTDSRVKFLRYKPEQYPYTVVLSKKYSTSDTAFVPRWYFLNDYRVSTEKSEFNLYLPSNLKYRHKENNFHSFEIQGTANATGVRYKAMNLMAIESEDLDPDLYDFTPNIQFALEDFHLKGISGNATTWKEYGSWIYNSLLQNKDELEPSTVAKMKALVKDIHDPKEKIKKVYQFVQNNTRYISVEMGIGGWMPVSAKEVDRVKYSDSKGLTNYTMALLKAIGIDSYYTIVSADSRMRSLDLDFPFLEGNHAFLNIPLDGEELWLECTSQKLPINFLGTFTDNRYVLKIGPNGGELVKSLQYTSEQSLQDTNARINIGEKETHALVEIKSMGLQYDQKYELSNQSKEKVERYYEQYWNYVNDINILSHDIENNKKNIVTVEKINLTSSSYTRKAGENIYFVPNMLNRNQFVPKKDKNRKRKIIIKRGYLDEDDFIIDYPENYEILSAIKNVNLKNDFGEYSVSLERISDKRLRYKRRLLIKPGTFANTLYDDYRTFRRTTAKIDASKIVFVKHD